MPQRDAWEREYKNPQLLKIGEEPRGDLRKYIKFLRKDEEVLVENLNILDLGSGNGKNANYLAQMGNNVIGLEISLVAIKLAISRAEETNIKVDYKMGDIGAPYHFDDGYFDLIVDVMSSNSLNEREREIYLKEVHRVLKVNGHFFVRALCKDGDKNAKNLLRQSPGSEYDTYINKDMNLTERVFSRDDFVVVYSKYFEIQKLIKKTNYAQFNRQSYKRNYWLAYMKKL
ncbi:MAG: class I SAM-dependent methyltransferase [Parcubacteria group bacterium]|nr:class I SAM-dependent methyltransferase [Parcubacteria group bacterium]